MMDEIYSEVDALATLGVSDQRASYFARYTLSQDMEEKVNSSGPIDCIAIYYDGGILRQYANDTASQRRIQLWDYLRENEQLFTQTLGSDQSKWYLLEIEGEYCLGNVYRTSGCTLLTLLRVEKLFANLSGYDEPQGAYALLSGEGELVLHSAGEPDRNLFPWKNAGAGRYTDYLIETRRLENGSLQLMFYEKRDQILSGLSALQLSVYAILTVAVISLALLLLFIRSQVLRPLREMLRGVGEVERENLKYQIALRGFPEEFKTLAREFNKMSGEVLSLRISQYEQKLQLTESRLRYLQMQIRPHFYLNALTTIHSMSMQGRGEDIRSYIDMLSVHIRYMLYGDMAMTDIGTELERVGNFVRMKELCFPGCVFYMNDVASPALLSAKMPKLMLLTIVENSFKYALNLYEMMNLLIKVDRYIKDGEAFIRLIVEDDGNGYPEEMLNNFEGFTGYSGGIGIQNVRDTFRLWYGRKGLVRIEKAVPHGARTVLFIPENSGAETPQKEDGNHVGTAG